MSLPAPAEAASPVIDAGPISARYDRSPWHLEIVERRGRTVLAEARATGPGAVGALGFRAGGAWFRATRVISDERRGDGVAARLATTDPGGRTIDLALRRVRPGVIELTAVPAGSGLPPVDAVGIAFAAGPDEGYLGFGERSNAVDQRGGSIESYVGEGTYKPQERPFITPFVPPWGFRQRDDATYFPMPWLLSTAGYGVLVDNAERSVFDLTESDPGAWTVAADARSLSLRVFAGPRPADVLRRLTEATGRQPRPAAPWFLAPWFQPWGDDRDEEALARRLLEEDAPVSVAQTFTHYLPCGDQRGRRAEERTRTRALQRLGLAVTTYFNPMICTSYQPVYRRAAERGLLTRDPSGAPYRYRYGTELTEDFTVSQVDFSAPGAEGFYGDLLREAVADGFDGWMEDFGEYTPPDARSANGMSGARMHNLYPVLYHRAAHRFAESRRRPLANFIRSGWTGVHPYARIVWGGDPASDWGFDGLASAVTNGLTMGLSGIAIWGSDIGGYLQLGPTELTPELLVRWIEFGAVSGVMRTQAEGVAVPPRERPQILDPEVLPHWRRYAKLRTQLYPYLAAATREYRRTGMPIMRHLALAYPDDAIARAHDEEFLFGPDLLAAPVIEEGATRRSLYLPPGRWVDFWDAVRYRERDGALRARGGRPLRGGRQTSVPAPLGRLPLFARAGSVVPLLPPAIDTLTDYGMRRGGLVHLADREGRLSLLALPRGRSVTRLADGGRIGARERRAGWLLHVRGKRSTRYSLGATLGTLRRRFVPCAVTLDGEPLRPSAWSARRGVLRARFAARSVRLLARRRCGE